MSESRLKKNWILFFIPLCYWRLKPRLRMINWLIALHLDVNDGYQATIEKGIDFYLLYLAQPKHYYQPVEQGIDSYIILLLSLFFLWYISRLKQTREKELTHLVFTYLIWKLNRNLQKGIGSSILSLIHPHISTQQSE